ncbi:type II secretion system F family protein [Haloparvum sedimenti]|uniref:type II secretion system F family protein n=1 Tax=Haloparvum sedimenti TaxID=1678448 RepID=UPI00071E6D2A|nr:type II secretion system F family protein [Haloparvum sedimenti]
MIQYVPLALALALCAGLGLPFVSRRADLLVSRVALSFFGDYVADESPRKREQQQRMRAAHAGGTHRVYAARTLLYAGTLGAAGSVLGVYVAAAFLALLEVGGEAIRSALPSALGFLADLTRLEQLAPDDLFVLLLFFSATVGSLLALGTYWVRWEVLSQRAVARASEIEATLPRTVAFVYALSRSGMAFPKVMDTLAKNERVYGEAATELGVAVRDMNTFGTDALTALQRTSERTPSENMEEFAENLASVLGSGRSLSDFLHEQYERYQEEAESQQEQYLELLSTFAEAYVTVLVAGPLFFITILVVVGLVIEDTLPLLRAVVYLGVPLASVAFIVYVDSVTQSLQSPGEAALRADEDGDPANPNGEFTLPDGGAVSDGWRADRERLAEYDRYRTALDWVERPVELLLRSPAVTAVITVPVALLWIVNRAAPIPIDSPLTVATAMDVPLVEATLFVLGGYGLVYEIQKRRTKNIEAQVPDFLDRLASINEAGMAVVESFERVTNSDLEDLTPELERTWRDIKWGADVETALHRMDRRIRSPMVGRSVALIVNAMRASGDIGPVLHIAADEARAARQLRRERNQVMLTYLIVIYISFFVFIGIIAALTVAFIPAIEQADVATGGGVSGVAGVGGGITEGLGDIDVAAYEVIFLHASVVQAVCSGLIGGQLGEGTVRDGVKHVVILLAITYVSFLAMGLI